MFEKLLSLVPYNPGLLHQLAFYSRRMREEAAIRRTGLIFMVLAFFIQFFAVLSPPQATVANSSNDIINGGFASKAEARAHCISDTQGFQRILHYYGISCRAFDAADADKVTINSTAQDNQYFSVGRNPTGSSGETPVNIPGDGNKLYWRHLSVWGKTSYETIRLRNQDGKIFYLMYDCGNLVSVGVPGPSPFLQGETTSTSFESAPTSTPTPTTPTPVTTTPQIPTPTPLVPQTPTPFNPTTPTPTPTPCPYNASLPADSPLCYEPCEFNASLPVGHEDCKPCDASVSSADALACIAVHKTASNVTAGTANADGTTAKTGDVITYTLYAQNKGKATVEDFRFQENLNDVLDYADVTDLHGGSLSSDKVVSWPALDIKAGETATKQITVKVKNPIPQTPVSSSDAAHFDLTMTNVYGNAVNIKLPGSPAKQVEVAAAKLPNTGPGETLAVITVIVILTGYFYGRARLLSRESQLALQDNHGA